MANIDRVNSELAKQISFVIQRKLRDPRVVNNMVTVTGVDTTKDLKLAKVYVSFYGNDEGKLPCIKALNNSASFIRNELKTLVNMRLIPTLTFILDESAVYADHMEKLINKAKESMVYFEDDDDLTNDR